MEPNPAATGHVHRITVFQRHRQTILPARALVLRERDAVARQCEVCAARRSGRLPRSSFCASAQSCLRGNKNIGYARGF
jgi:hypothetical protein